MDVQQLMVYAIVLLTIGFLASDYDHWHSQIMLGQIASLGWLSYEINKRVHILPAMTFFYFSAYTAYCCFRVSDFAMPSADIQGTLDGATGRSLVFLICVCLPFIFATKKDLKNWLVAFQVFAIADSAYMFYWLLFKRQQNGWRGATGMIGMDSVDGTFLALMLPSFVFSKTLDKCEKGSILFIVGCALFVAKSSTVYGVVTLEVITFVLVSMHWTTKNLAKTFLGSLSVPAIGYFYMGRELLNDSGRKPMLVLSFNVFKSVITSAVNLQQKIFYVLFGLGTGSFISLMPALQNTNHGFFVWLHDEPMQIIFEQGLVGFILISALYSYSVFRNRKNIPMLVTLVAAGFQSFLQPSFRYFIFALFLTFLLRASFETEEVVF